MDHPVTTKLIVFITLLGSAGSVSGQYDTVFVGAPEAISFGPFETPFPTGGALVSRTQYLFRAEELDAILLPNNSVYGLLLDVLDSDLPGTTVDLDLKLKNTVMGSLADLEYSGLHFVADTFDLQLQAGMLAIPFNQSSWQWLGAGMNMVVEFCMHRSGPAGVDPRVTLDTSFTFTPTYYVHDSVDFPACQNLTSANPGVIHGAFDARPVMGFLVEATTGLDGLATGRPQVALYPNPANDQLRLRLPEGPSVITAQVFASSGAKVQQWPRIMSDTTGFVDLRLQALAPGCYLLRITDVQGRPIWDMPFIVE